MRTVRASEIGTFIYCRRAWWYHLQGVVLGNQSDLAAGNELHQNHNRRVLVSGLIRSLGWLMLMASLILMTVYLTELIIR
jgi:hypothetical protein